MKKIIISIFISGIVFFCNAQTKAEENNSNSRQTEVVPTVENVNKGINQSEGRQVNSTVRINENDSVPSPPQQPAEEKSSKKTATSGKLREE
jgi:hypothetical protein